MNRKPARAVLFILLFLVLAGGGLFSYFRWFKNGSKGPDLETILSVVDEDISKGYYTKAADTLSACKSFSGNSSAWLRIISRGEAISRALHDYSYLSACADAAVKDLPGNEELWALRVYGLLREQKYTQAFSLGHKHLADKRYQSLIAEAALHLGPEEIDSKKVEGNEYWRMFMTEGGGAPETYEDYARATQDDRIFAAAAIAWMIEGNTERAVENCTQIQGDEYIQLLIFIYYDAGKYEDAYRLLKSSRGTGRIGDIEGKFLEADLLMAMEKYADAENVYERIVRDAPAESWIPYLNIVWIKTKNGEIQEAADYIFRALEIFPKNEEVELALSLFLIQFGRSGRVQELIERMSEKLKEDSDIGPRLERSLGLSQSPEQYKAVLWQLFNRSERNIKIAQFFAWYLLGLHDYKNLELVLEKSERKFGEMEWINFFYGSMYAVRGETERAEENFEKAAEKLARLETFYNLALLSLQYGDNGKAVEYFGMAEQKIRKQDEIKEPKALAQIKVKTAQIHIADERYDAAKRAVLEALDYDPDNLEAQLIKKKLEAGIKR